MVQVDSSQILACANKPQQKMNTSQTRLKVLFVNFRHIPPPGDTEISYHANRLLNDALHVIWSF